MSHKTLIKSFGNPRDLQTLKRAVELRTACLANHELLSTMPMRAECEWLGWGNHQAAMLGSDKHAKGFGIRLRDSRYVCVLSIPHENDVEANYQPGGRHYEALQSGKLQLQMTVDDMYAEEYQAVFAQLMASGGFYAQAAIIQEAEAAGHSYELQRLVSGETIIEVNEQSLKF